MRYRNNESENRNESEVAKAGEGWRRNGEAK